MSETTKQIHLALAPMEGLTGFVFRQVHSALFGGADSYWIPFVTPTTLPKFTERQLRELAPEVNKGFRAVPQLLTRRVEDFCWASKALHDLGYDEVNLNLGCPAGTVVAKGKGSGFLRTPVELEHFLAEIFSKDLPIAISVKTRIGWSDEEEFDLLADIYNHYPMKSLTIHPRLKTDHYKGEVRKHVFDKYYDTFKMPVGYNGDIITESHIADVAARYAGLDHIMVGRALMADPALFRKAKGGAPATLKELKNFHYELLEGYARAFDNRKNAMMRLKEYWFFQSCLFEGADKQVKAIYKAKTLEEFDAAVNAIWDNCALRPFADYGWYKSL